MPEEPIDFLAAFEAKRRADAKAMTNEQLLAEFKRLTIIIENADDSTYAGVATGDCAADDREFIEAEIRTRGLVPAL